MFHTFTVPVPNLAFNTPQINIGEHSCHEIKSSKRPKIILMEKSDVQGKLFNSLVGN